MSKLIARGQCKAHGRTQRTNDNGSWVSADIMPLCKADMWETLMTED